MKEIRIFDIPEDNDMPESVAAMVGFKNDGSVVDWKQIKKNKEMKELPFDVVKIEWVDSISGSSWEGINSAKDIRPGNAVSVGFLLDAGEDYVTICQNYIGDKGQEQICNTMSIPRVAIRSIVNITPINYNDPTKAVDPNRGQK